MRALAFAFCLGLAGLGVRPAAAQVYPARPITVVVPVPAGSATDALARMLAESMRQSLDQPVIIENVVGAGGSIGVGRVAHAQPDGYTLVIGNWNTHVSAGAIHPVRYDALKDLEPISLLPVSRLWIVGRQGLPARDAAELIAWLRVNPDGATAAIVGTGSAAQLCAINLQDKTGVGLRLVSYRGGPQAYQDLLAGQIDLMCAEASATLPYVREGRLKAYAVLATSRWPSAPEVPTMDEVGVPGLHISFWHGLWAPKGTPREIIAKLNAAVVEAMRDPGVIARLAALGQEVPPHSQQTPEALGAHHKAEIEEWWPVIKAANIKPE
jgi:tripartite-type tricarboxylate transporter receptor subunit TctC